MITHNTHITRFSDSSLYDEVCVNCGATDSPTTGKLDKSCPKPKTPYKTEAEFWISVEEKNAPSNLI